MKTNQLKMGVILSYITLIIGNIIPLFYTPWMLNILGKSEYGIYSLSNSIVGYLSLLSFGLGNSMVKFITDYIAKEDKKGEKNIINLFLFIYIIISVIAILVGIFIIFNVRYIFNQGLTNEEINKMKVLLLLVSINTSISFLASVFGAIVMSYERYIFNKVLSLITTILGPITSIIMLLYGFKSVGLAMSAMIVNLIYLSINILYCYVKLNIRISFKKIDFSPIKIVFSFSVYIFINEIVNMLYWSTDKFILGMYMGAIYISIYTVGASFNNYFISLSTAISNVIFPKINKMVNKNASDLELTNLFIKIGRLQYIILALAGSGFVLFGKPFIRLWVGSSYMDAYWVAILTIIPSIIPLIQNTGLSIIQAKNIHQYRTKNFLVIAILNVILSLILVKSFGMIGCAVATSIAYIIGPVICMNRFYYKKAAIDIPLFWNNILNMSKPIFILIFVYIVILNKIDILNWRSFFINIIIYSIIYALLLWKYSMNNYEKQLISRVFLKILKKQKIKNMEDSI